MNGIGKNIDSIRLSFIASNSNTPVNNNTQCASISKYISEFSRVIKSHGVYFIIRHFSQKIYHNDIEIRVKSQLETSPRNHVSLYSFGNCQLDLVVL
jgi:hypothetical protein